MTDVGLAWAGPDPLTDSLFASIEGAAAELGITVRAIASPADEGLVDVLLIVGYPRSYAAFLDAPRIARRVAWFGEPLPRNSEGNAEPSRRLRPVVATSLGLLKRGLGPLTKSALPGVAGRLREAAAIAEERAANLADAIRCSKQVDRVVVTSRDRAGILRAHGIDPTVVPFGYHRAGAGPLVAPDGSERDVAVAVIGSGIHERRLRRGRVVARIGPRLRSMGIGSVVNLEGVWGAERNAILSRTKVVLDIQRIPGNFTGLRFLTSMAAGAVLVAEPIDDPHPFVPGVDHLEASEEELAEVIASVVSDDECRLAIANAGQARLTADLTMRASLERVLAA